MDLGKSRVFLASFAALFTHNANEESNERTWSKLTLDDGMEL